MPVATFAVPEEEMQEIEVEEGTEIAAAMEELDLNPVTYLVKENDRVVPHRKSIEEDATFELVTVVSGG